MRTNTAGMKSIDFRPPPDNGKGLVIVAMAIVVTGVPSLRMGAVGNRFRKDFGAHLCGGYCSDPV